MGSLILPDVNVLLAAHRESHVHNASAQAFLKSAYEQREVIGYCDIVLSGVLRLATHRKIFANPSTPDEVFRYIEKLRSFPGAIRVEPGLGHWKIFQALCQKSGATGATVTDAYIAAIAVEHGFSVATFDNDFEKIPGVRVIKLS